MEGDVRLIKQFRFFEANNGGGSPPAPAPVVVPQNEAVTGATIDHSAKIAELSGKLNQTESDFYRRLSEQDENTRRMIEESKSGYQEQINAMQAKIEALNAPPPAPEPQGVPFVAPEIEKTKVPPEKMSRGLRARRLERRKNK